MKIAAVVLASIAVARCGGPFELGTVPPPEEAPPPEEVPAPDGILRMFEGWQAAFAGFELDRLENGKMGNGQTQCPDGGHFAWSYLFDDATYTFQAVATPQWCSFTYEEQSYTVIASSGSSGVTYTYNPVVVGGSSLPRLELSGSLYWSSLGTDYYRQCRISVVFTGNTPGTLCGFSVNRFDVAFPEHITGVGNRVVGQFPSDWGPPDSLMPEVPSEATAGVPFEIELWTEGGGCVRTVDTAEVSVDGSTAVVTPYDVYSFTGTCFDDLWLFTHRADIVFDSPGQAEVNVRYSTSGHRIRDADVLKTYTVEVLAATTGSPDG